MSTIFPLRSKNSYVEKNPPPILRANACDGVSAAAPRQLGRRRGACPGTDLPPSRWGLGGLLRDQAPGSLSWVLAIPRGKCPAIGDPNHPTTPSVRNVQPRSETSHHPAIAKKIGPKCERKIGLLFRWRLMKSTQNVLFGCKTCVWVT